MNFAVLLNLTYFCLSCFHLTKLSNFLCLITKQIHFSNDPIQPGLHLLGGQFASPNLGSPALQAEYVHFCGILFI